MKAKMYIQPETVIHAYQAEGLLNSATIFSMGVNGGIISAIEEGETDVEENDEAAGKSWGGWDNWDDWDE